MSEINKKSLTETDIRTKFITPAITGKDGGKWNVMTQMAILLNVNTDSART